MTARPAFFVTGIRPGDENSALTATALGFHRLFNRCIVPCTAVDNTFQVLLRLALIASFPVTAQTFELVGSPFRATVRVRR
jgi:hypothetical protein